jgi:hypothetical protein
LLMVNTGIACATDLISSSLPPTDKKCSNYPCTPFFDFPTSEACPIPKQDHALFPCISFIMRSWFCFLQSLSRRSRLAAPCCKCRPQTTMDTKEAKKKEEISQVIFDINQVMHIDSWLNICISSDS